MRLSLRFSPCQSLVFLDKKLHRNRKYYSTSEKKVEPKIQPESALLRGISRQPAQELCEGLKTCGRGRGNVADQGILGIDMP